MCLSRLRGIGKRRNLFAKRIPAEPLRCAPLEVEENDKGDRQRYQCAPKGHAEVVKLAIGLDRSASREVRLRAWCIGIAFPSVAKIRRIFRRRWARTSTTSCLRRPRPYKSNATEQKAGAAGAMCDIARWPVARFAGSVAGLRMLFPP